MNLPCECMCIFGHVYGVFFTSFVSTFVVFLCVSVCMYVHVTVLEKILAQSENIEHGLILHWIGIADRIYEATRFYQKMQFLTLSIGDIDLFLMQVLS